MSADSMAFEPRLISRRDGPSTSMEAAEKAGGLRDRHHALILKAFRERPGTLLAKEHLADITGLEGVQISRRLHELVKDGRLRRTTERHRNRGGRKEGLYAYVPEV